MHPLMRSCYKKRGLTQRPAHKEKENNIHNSGKLRPQDTMNRFADQSLSPLERQDQTSKEALLGG